MMESFSRRDVFLALRVQSFLAFEKLHEDMKLIGTMGRPAGLWYILIILLYYICRLSYIKPPCLSF